MIFLKILDLTLNFFPSIFFSIKWLFHIDLGFHFFFRDLIIALVRRVIVVVLLRCVVVVFLVPCGCGCLDAAYWLSSWCSIYLYDVNLDEQSIFNQR